MPPDLSRFRPVLISFFRKRAHPADVEDLVQDVFLSMQARQAETPIDNVEGYLFAVAMSALVRKSRQEKPWRWQACYEDEDDAGHFPEEHSPERVLLGKERLAKAVRIMRDLPPRTQEVFLLHRFEEMTYPAIATALGMSVSAVEKHIMIALKRLVADLGRHQ
jgi:RNA polymerase sigma factor (sigma-70 family)